MIRNELTMHKHGFDQEVNTKLKSHLAKSVTYPGCGILRKASIKHSIGHLENT